MQFFPSVFSDMFTGAERAFSPEAALALISGNRINPVDGARSFGEIFNNLAEFNADNLPGVPRGFRSVREERAGIKNADLSFLKEKLEKSGVAPQTLEHFLERLHTLHSAPTVGNIFSMARNLGERSGPPLNEQEDLAFSALLSRLGLEQPEIDGLREASFKGEGKTVLEAVSAGLKKKSGQEARSPESFKLSKEEAALLCRAADLSGETGSELLEMFGEAAELPLDPPAFKRLFGAALAETTRKEAELSLLREHLPLALRDMFEKKRFEKDAPSADNKSGRQAERLETLAREAATSLREDSEASSRKGNALIRRASIAANLQASREETPPASPVPVRGGKAAAPSARSERAEQAAPKAQPAASGQDPLFLPRADQALLQDARELLAVSAQPKPAGEERKPDPSQARSGIPAPREEVEPAPVPLAGDERKTREDPQSLGAKHSETRREDGQASSQSPAREEHIANFAFNPADRPENSAGETGAVKISRYQEQIFEQVEKGLVRTLADGAKQIVLRLDPPELGNITLSLTMAQGEVKAVIRTENPATTQAISEQLSQLKASLEEQGIKVAGLEVETRSQSHSGTDQWNGAEQHNQRQEMQEQSNLLRLAQFRARESERLAQSVHSEDIPADNSAAGLHLIA